MAPKRNPTWTVATPRTTTIFPLTRRWHGGGHSHSSHHSHLHPTANHGFDEASKRLVLAGGLSNVVLSALKGASGVLFHSPALIADAVHSLSDLVSDVLTYFGLKVSSKAPDEVYPYGYGRYETVATLSVSGLLILGSLSSGWNSYDCLFSSAAVEPNMMTQPGALWVALFSVVVKEALFRISMRVAERTGSRLLVANAWHHRSDALSSIVALVGISGALLGVPMLDPIGGLVVSLMIIKASVDLSWESLQELLDRNTVADIKAQVTEAVQPLRLESSDIRDVHDIRSRRMGATMLMDVHVAVNPFMSVSAAHVAGLRVRQAIMSKIPLVSNVLVHIDPELAHLQTLPPMQQDQLEFLIRSALQHDSPHIKSVDQVVYHHLSSKNLVEVLLVVDDDLTIQRAREIAMDAKKRLERLEQVDEAHVGLRLMENEVWKSVPHLSRSESESRATSTTSESG